MFTSQACRYIPLLESARAFRLLGALADPTRRALARAECRIRNQCFTHFCAVGECAPITVAYMRYLNALRTEQANCLLAMFLKRLVECRNGSGRWEGFPFYYTLLMLNELDPVLAREERRYAAAACERLLERAPEGNVIAWRRRTVLRQALN